MAAAMIATPERNKDEAHLEKQFSKMELCHDCMTAASWYGQRHQLEGRQWQRSTHGHTDKACCCMYTQARALMMQRLDRQYELTCLAASQNIHESGLARPTAPHQGSQDARPETAAAVVQQLQHILAVDHCCFGTQLLRVSGYPLHRQWHRQI